MLSIEAVVFPTDRTAHAERAFAHAVRFARDCDAALHVLNVDVGQDPTGAPVLSEPSDLDAFSARLHSAAAESVGVRVVHATMPARSVQRGILDYAEQANADLVVLATHGREGLEHALIGSVAEGVVRRAHCPVVTVRPAPTAAPTAPRSVLVPIDFSAHSRTALAYAREVARPVGAALHLLHVHEVLPRYGLVDVPPEPPPMSGEMQESLHAALRAVAAEVLGPETPPTTHVASGLGNAAVGVLDEAERLSVDLIVQASHGRTGPRRFFAGSVAERVVQLAPCPVLTVKAFGKSLLPGAGARGRSSHERTA